MAIKYVTAVHNVEINSRQPVFRYRVSNTLDALTAMVTDTAARRRGKGL